MRRCVLLTHSLSSLSYKTQQLQTCFIESLPTASSVLSETSWTQKRATSSSSPISNASSSSLHTNGATFSFTASPISSEELTGLSSPSSPSLRCPLADKAQQYHGYSTVPSQAPYTDLSPPVIISPSLCRVVVIGWMGCKKKYLQKYAHLWMRSGDHEVLSIRPSVPMTLFRWRGIVTAGTDIDKVARMHIENGGMPTIYHIFSTGGFIHAATMWKWMNQVEDIFIRKSLLDEVKGIIFDSGPAKVTQEMVAKAMVSATLDTPAHTIESRPVQGRLLSIARSAVSWYMQKKHIRRRQEEVHEAWYEMAPVCPQLYLYSEADPLANPQDIERFMQIQATRGVEVSSYKWQDSGHCEHYRRYPHEYAFHVSQFTNHALKDW